MNNEHLFRLNQGVSLKYKDQGSKVCLPQDNNFQKWDDFYERHAYYKGI